MNLFSKLAQTFFPVQQSSPVDLTENKLLEPAVLPSPLIKLSSSVVIDPSKCIGCGACVKACSQHEVGYLKLAQSVGQPTAAAQSSSSSASQSPKIKKQVAIVDRPDLACIYCGQCSLACPTGAIQEQSQVEEVKAALADPNLTVIVQMAPALRVSIGEEFGLPPGQNLEGQLYTALRQLKFDQIFDVNFGADITTMVEAQELVERLTSHQDLPMFTACCPAWVEFVQFYFPEFLSNLTTACSPHIHSGAAFKNWWAVGQQLDPSKIRVVSIMPCTAKKHEASLEKFKIAGQAPVDWVLTTRELAGWLKEAQIDLPNLAVSQPDSLGMFSGAAAIYGTAGGVMESALRTVAYLLTGQDQPLAVDFLRTSDGIKTAKVKIGDLELKLASVSTMANARRLLGQLKQQPHLYDYVEFMACSGGCIGGGGQPRPTSPTKIAARQTALYHRDEQSPIKAAHQNPLIQQYWAYLKTLPAQQSAALLKTSYHSTKSEKTTS